MGGMKKELTPKQGKAKPHKKAGRKPVFSPDTAMEVICALIARGKSLVQITSSGIPGVPSYELVMKWLRDDDLTDGKRFIKMYARAREDAADFLADEIIAIADDSSDDELFTDEGKRIENKEFVNRSKLRVDARKWVAAKLKPRKYGEKIELDNKHSGEVNLSGVLRVPNLTPEQWAEMAKGQQK
jgi:hypothetical protein